MKGLHLPQPLLLFTLVFAVPLCGESEDKIFLKGASTPTVGTILRVEKSQIILQLDASGSTSLPISKVDHIEMPTPEKITQGLEAAASGRNAEAMATLEPAVIPFAGLPIDWAENGLFQLFRIHAATHDWSRVRERSSQFRSAYPQSPLLDAAIAHEGRALFELKKTDEAQEILESLLQSHSKDPALTRVQDEALAMASITLGKCYLQKKQQDKALDSFLSATTLYVTLPDAIAEGLYESALLFEKKNNIPRARDQLEELLQQYPSASNAPMVRKKLETLPNKSQDSNL